MSETMQAATLAIFDAGAAWDRLPPDEQRRLGMAALMFGCGSAVQDDGGHGHAVLVCERTDAGLMDMFAAAYEDALDGLGVDGCCIPDLNQVGIRQCTFCGCTDRHGCPEGCHWAGPTLCSACTGVQP